MKPHQPQPWSQRRGYGQTLIGLEAWAHASVGYNREASLYKGMSLNQSSYSLAYLSIFEFLSFIFRQILKPVIGRGGWDCPMACCAWWRGHGSSSSPVLLRHINCVSRRALWKRGWSHATAWSGKKLLLWQAKLTLKMAEWEAYIWWMAISVSPIRWYSIAAFSHYYREPVTLWWACTTG